MRLGEVLQEVQLAGEVARQRAPLRLAHHLGIVDRAAEEILVGAGQRRFAMRIDEETGERLDEFIAGGPGDRP